MNSIIEIEIFYSPPL